MNKNYRDWLLNIKNNVIVSAVYIVLMFIISPLFPGVNWFNLGDFTLDVVNYYHGIMIPLALLLIIVTAKVFKIPEKLLNFIILTNYPVILLSFLGVVLFYPSWATLSDEIIQAIRDVIMLISAILLIIGMLYFPVRFKNDFKKIFAGYLLTLIAAISATIAAIMGMIYEYGSLYTFSSIPWFNSLVTSWGGLSTFLGNVLTSHSHQMLPAVMGGIVGLTAVIFGYHKISSRYIWFVNIGLLISFIGIISMSYIYFISSFGTYSIPTLFTSGPGGVNGLALDDSQTGLVGFGAIISIFGLISTFEKNSGNRFLQITSISTWVGAMAALVGIGYVIEFNEAYYGFGSPGTPPTGGPGYLYDEAFMNGHLLYAFFMLVIISAFFAISYYLTRKDEKTDKIKIFASYTGIAGILVGYEGLLIYVLTLSWYVLALGLILLLISAIITTWNIVIVKNVDYNII